MNNETLLDVDNISEKNSFTIKIDLSTNKEHALDIMMESINKDNLEFGLKSGMNKDDLNKQIENSQQSLMFIMSNIYDKLVEANIIVV